MYIPFNELPDSARVWIYQSSKKLKSTESDYILEKGRQFIESWTAHNQSLKASIDIRRSQFIILSVDEGQAAASGCSIDKSVHFIQSLEADMGLSLMDNSNIAFLAEDEVEIAKFPSIKAIVIDGKIKADSLVFNNRIEDIDGLKNRWIIPASDSWMERFFV